MKVYFAVEKMLKNCDGSNMASINHSAPPHPQKIHTPNLPKKETVILSY